MALQKQKVTAPFVGGLDTKTDERNLAGTSFLELENWRFTKTGSLTKRNGFSKYAQATQAGSQISSGKAVSSFKNELLLFDGANISTYFEPEQSWISKGAHENTLAKEHAIYNSGLDFSAMTFATENGITVYLMGGQSSTTDANAAQTVVVVDQATQEIISTFSFDGYGTNYGQISVAAFNGRFFLCYKSSATDFSYRYIDSEDLSTVSSPTALGTFDYIYTLAAFGQLYIFLTDIGAAGSAVILDSNFATSATVTMPAANYTIKAATEGMNIRLVYNNTSDDLVSVLYNSDLNTTIHAVVNIETAGAIEDYCVVQSATNTSMIFYNWADNLNNLSISVYRRAVYIDGARGDKTLSQYGAQLESEVYYDSSVGKFYYLLSKPFGIQYQTFYLASDGGLGASMISQFGARTAVTSTAMQKPVKIADSLFFCTSVLAGAQELTAAVQVPTTAVQLEADFSQRFNYFDQVLGNNLYISGGVLKNYDGAQLVEHGFLEVPENGHQLSAAPTTAGDNDVGTLVSSAGSGSGLLTHGAYQVTYVYVYRDRFGQIYRSAPAVPWQVIIDSTNVPTDGRGRMTHYARTPNLTDKELIEIEWYRTEVNGSILYKITNSDNSFNNRSLVPKSTAINAWTQWPFAASQYDVAVGAALTSSEIIYTEGGELEVNAAGPSKMITAYKNRLFLLSSDGKTVFYTKELLQGTPAEFNDSLTIDLDNKGGDGISLISMDDYVVVLKEQAIYVFGGEGPNALGEQGDYRRPVEVNSDTGCNEPNSVVRIPAGIMFKSEKGIYMLSRALAVDYIGAPVERYNPTAVTSATLIQESNEVRFTTDANRVLVYDYFHKFWTTFTPINAIDSVNHNGAYHWLTSDGRLYKEEENHFHDNGSFIKTRLRTAWVQFAGTQGYQRFYSLQVLGAYKSPHKLRAQFAYDYDPDLINAVTVPVTSRMGLVSYGEGDYGNGNYGGKSLMYQWEVRPKIQKCQAFQIVIEDVQDGVPGESLLLSNFALEMGILPGTQRTPTSGKFGAS